MHDDENRTPGPVGPLRAGHDALHRGYAGFVAAGWGEHVAGRHSRIRPHGQPVRNLSLRIEMAVGGIITDFGRLSSKDASTGSDGRATVVYTAPAPVDNVDRNTRVQIMVTPVNGNYNGTFARFAEIRLVPTGVVGGETGVPDFRFSPEAPTQLQTVTFDASDPQLDQTLTKYEWDFGDGSKGQGRVSSTSTATSTAHGDVDSHRHRRPQGLALEERACRHLRGAHRELCVLAEFTGDWRGHRVQRGRLERCAPADHRQIRLGLRYRQQGVGDGRAVHVRHRGRV